MSDPLPRTHNFYNGHAMGRHPPGSSGAGDGDAARPLVYAAKLRASAMSPAAAAACSAAGVEPLALESQREIDALVRAHDRAVERAPSRGSRLLSRLLCRAAPEYALVPDGDPEDDAAAPARKAGGRAAASRIALGCLVLIASTLVLALLGGLALFAIVRPTDMLGAEPGATHAAHIDSAHLYAWTTGGDPVADVAATVALAGGGGPSWARVVPWVRGRVTVGGADYVMFLDNADELEAAARGPPAKRGRRVADLVLADARASSSAPLRIGVAHVPATRPDLHGHEPTAGLFLAGTYAALDPAVLEQWVPRIAALGKAAPDLRVRLVGEPRISMWGLGKAVKVEVATRLSVANLFKTNFDVRAENARFDPEAVRLDTEAVRLDPKGTLGGGEDDEPPEAYVLRLNVTLRNPLPISARLPLAVRVPVYDVPAGASAAPLVELVGDWLREPVLEIPGGDGGGRARIPAAVRVPSRNLPRVFALLQQYQRGERVALQIGPGTEMQPAWAVGVGDVVSRAHGRIAVQKPDAGEIFQAVLDAM